MQTASFNIKGETYSTKDTALASWLYSQGIQLKGLRKENSLATMEFENSEGLGSLILLWQKGEALGNCVNYENARKKLLRLIKRD